jgi:hypothetical protein
MIEVPVKIENQPKIDFEIHAKSHKGIIQSLLLKFSKDAKYGRTYTPYELQMVFSEALNKYNELKKNSDLVTLELEGWKGKDIIVGYKGFDNDFILIEHRKDKETGEVETIRKEVTKENVNKLWDFIKTWKIKESRECYAFAEIVGEISWEEVWKKRTDVYFPKYYYPIKCLELMGLIKYSGRGKVTRLK